jgi:hypothetical protein
MTTNPVNVICKEKQKESLVPYVSANVETG